MLPNNRRAEQPHRILLECSMVKGSLEMLPPGLRANGSNFASLGIQQLALVSFCISFKCPSDGKTSSATRHTYIHIHSHRRPYVVLTMGMDNICIPVEVANLNHFRRYAC